MHHGRISYIYIVPDFWVRNIHCIHIISILYTQWSYCTLVRLSYILWINLIYLPMFFKDAPLFLGHDCPSASKVILMDMSKIYYNRAITEQERVKIMCTFRMLFCNYKSPVSILRCDIRQTWKVIFFVSTRADKDSVLFTPILAGS